MRDIFVGTAPAKAEPEIRSSEIAATAIVLGKVTKYLSSNSRPWMSEAYRHRIFLETERMRDQILPLYIIRPPRFTELKSYLLLTLHAKVIHSLNASFVISVADKLTCLFCALLALLWIRWRIDLRHVLVSWKCSSRCHKKRNRCKNNCLVKSHLNPFKKAKPHDFSKVELCDHYIST